MIPNFVNTERYDRNKEPCHRGTLAPGGEKIVMHVSNFRAVKRVTDVVEVFARLARRVRARLVLVGDGPDRPLAIERVEELELEDKVVFLGRHDAVDELLRCCDLFLLPSESESFGLAALEAMACGAPVIATRTGGLVEVIPEGIAGNLFPVGDVEAMGDAAIAVLSDRSRWRRMSAAAREIAVGRFSAKRVVPVYEAYYREILAGRAAPALAK